MLVVMLAGIGRCLITRPTADMNSRLCLCAALNLARDWLDNHCRVSCTMTWVSDLLEKVVDGVSTTISGLPQILAQSVTTIRSDSDEIPMWLTNTARFMAVFARSQ